MPTRYGQSPWLDRFPRSRVPSYPAHRGHLDVDVVIVGGGLTGCAAAYAFAAHGVHVALVEADRLGRGVTAAAAGWLADDPGVGFGEIEHALGLRAARHAWHTWRRAALDAAALVRRLDLKCHLEPRPTLLVAATPDEAARLKREQKARRAAGLDAPLVNARSIAAETALTAAAAIRTRAAATLDPYRACLGLAAAAAARGARLFDRSAVKKITFDRKTADLQTSAGAIHTRRIVVATGSPTTLFRGLRRHFWFRHAYLALTEPVPARVRHHLGARAAIVRDMAAPPHVVRWVDGERLLVEGADAEAPPDRHRSRIIVQRTGQLMYELSTFYPEISGLQPSHGWDAPYARTADGLPYIGPHRNYPHHLFAFGDASHGVTGAFLASRVLLRHHLGQADASDDAFGFNR